VTAVRVDPAALLLVLAEPRPEFANREAGEVRTHFETGAPMASVDVALTQPGLKPETVTVSVPQPSVPDGLALGMPVRATALTLRTGTGKNGKAYAMFSADALTVVKDV
jgi:hypothetical protein